MDRIQTIKEQNLRKIKSFLWIRTEVFNNPDLSGSDIMVYASLMSHMNNKTKECYPSIARIAKEARLSKDTVIKCLRKLEETKLISRKHTNGKVNNYIILEPCSG